MGAGPLQRGTIHDGAKFAGMTIRMPKFLRSKKNEPHQPSDVTIADAHQFVHPAVLEQQIADAKAAEEAKVVPASHEQEADATDGDKK